MRDGVDAGSLSLRGKQVPSDGRVLNLQAFSSGRGGIRSHSGGNFRKRPSECPDNDNRGPLLLGKRPYRRSMLQYVY